MWIPLLATVVLGLPPGDALDARLAALESEVARLAARRTGADPEARSDEWRHLVAEALADADGQDAFAGAGLRSGWDDGFFIADADGRFRLEISGRMQVRWAYSHQEQAPDGDDNRAGFEVRRAQIQFDGHVADPSWQYRIRLGFRRGTGIAGLEDAYARKRFDGGWSLRVGRFKAPFFREHNISTRRQLAVERSMVSHTFSQGRTQGIELARTDTDIRISGSINSGFDGGDSTAVEDGTDWAMTGRIEWVSNGDFSRFNDFTSWPTDVGVAMLLGAAVHAQRDADGVRTASDETLIAWTADASIEASGANISAAVVGRRFDSDGRDQVGVVVQGGFFFAARWELFARSEWADANTPGVDDLNVLTFGINYYRRRQALKWTTDVGVGLSAVGAPFAFRGANWREDAPGSDGQVVVRSQLQFLF